MVHTVFQDTGISMTEPGDRTPDLTTTVPRSLVTMVTRKVTPGNPDDLLHNLLGVETDAVEQLLGATPQAAASLLGVS